MLKAKYENPNKRSAHYQKQPPFRGSNRQIRGMILNVLTSKSSVSEREIVQKLQTDPEKLRINLTQLEKEGFVRRRGGKFTIA